METLVTEKQRYLGPERRIQDHTLPIVICKYEDSIKSLYETGIRTEASIKALDLRINGTLEKMTEHVNDSAWWRNFIMGTAITMVLSLLGWIVTAWITTSSLSYNLGQYSKQIQINTGRLSLIEEDLRTGHARDNTRRIDVIESNERLDLAQRVNADGKSREKSNMGM
jgi:hypothetical protein